MNSRTVPLRGSKEYKTAFAAFAMDQGKSMAELVRDALDQVYGDKMKVYVSFFASGDGRNHQTSPVGIKGEENA